MRRLMKSRRTEGIFPAVLPILPLKDMVVFPHVMVPLFLKGSRVVKLAESVMDRDNLVGLFYQRSANRSVQETDSISLIGTLARIQQVVRLDSGGVKAIADGICRIRLTKQLQMDPFITGEVELVEEDVEPGELLDSFVRTVSALFKVSASFGRPLSEKSMAMIEKAEDPGRLADLIAVYLPLKAEAKQRLLEMEDPLMRLKQVSVYLQAELQTIQRNNQSLNDGQDGPSEGKPGKGSNIRNQIRGIPKDSGMPDEMHLSEIKEFHLKIRQSRMSADAAEVAIRELQRLEKIPPHSPEYIVSRSYLEVLTGLPWDVKTEDIIDLPNAQKILDEDHYDLVKVKDRILEFLAVRKLKDNDKGPILCLVGPPGVGKTSLGRSVARALGRKFVRMSLGGVRDEAEIRGHRRTYIGAMPGRIIQEIRRVATKNPVFMLDEVDKIGQDFRGDPASALLEVLDPEQNNSFCDHYVDVPFDLSSVMFIATANQLDTIPAPLRDRMEVIQVRGYTDEEKLKIAEIFLLPKALEQNGLADHQIGFSTEAIRTLIRGYTREAGVRQLERAINAICRKIALEVAQERPQRTEVALGTVEELLGSPQYFFELAEEYDQVGIATGLAWTENGGDIIFVEVTGFKGRKELTMTGCLGDVMQESARAALSYLRNTCDMYGISDRTLSKTDLHIHVPAGSIPKDGPSAGITIAVALTSFFTGIPIKRNVAMTGEVTLRGRVLPIGGVKEKLLAARRAGVREVILPKKNWSNLKDLPDYVKEDLVIHLVNDVDEAIRLALVEQPNADVCADHSDQPSLPFFSPLGSEYGPRLPSPNFAKPRR